MSLAHFYALVHLLTSACQLQAESRAPAGTGPVGRYTV